MKRVLVLAAVLVAVSVAPSFAVNVYTEVGDAGDLTATGQATSSGGGLDQINGTLVGNSDKDLYAIKISTPGSFSAHIWNQVMDIDPDIWLFDAAGNGLAHSDVTLAGTTSVSGIFVPAPGIYYIGISSDGAEALSLNGQMWSSGPSAARATDGPGAGLPLIGWGGSPLNDKVNYEIHLFGAEAVVTPEPTSLAGLAIATALLRRRRK